MTAQDATIADLQQRLHDENQRRFEQIEKNQDNLASKFVELGRTLEEVVTNTSCLQQLKEDVADIEKDRNKIKGAVKLGVGMGGFSLLAEGMRWLWNRH